MLSIRPGSASPASPEKSEEAQYYEMCVMQKLCIRKIRTSLPHYNFEISEGDIGFAATKCIMILKSGRNPAENIN